MKDPGLKTKLLSLVDRYGVERVSREVDRIAVSVRRAADGKHDLDRAARENGRQRPRTTTPEYVGKMDISPDRRTAMLALAARFDEKSFLPAWADIRHFCEMYGIEAPASKSRAGAIPKVFSFWPAWSRANYKNCWIEERSPARPGWVRSPRPSASTEEPRAAVAANFPPEK